MSDDIKLNKPLYKDEDGFTPPAPRHPRASIIGRAAALFLDIMLLRLLFALVVRFLPDPVLALGPVAPWVGLLLGFAYFGVGFSRHTLGRTLGKLILRVQVADIQGPDLPLGRAMLRALVLLWPLAVLLALRQVAEHYANVDPASVFTTVEVYGWMLILGWGFGNLGFAALDSYGRGVHDRGANSIIINAELEPAPVAAYLADAREMAGGPPARSSVMALGFALALSLAFAAASSIEVARQLREMSPEGRARLEAMVHEKYGRAWPSPPPDTAQTTGVLPVNFNFRKRGHLDVEAIKTAGDTTRTLDRLVGATLSSTFAEELQQYMFSANRDRARRGEGPTSVPEQMKFELGYAEYADLFFASEVHPVYTVGRIVDIPTTATVGAEGGVVDKLGE